MKELESYFFVRLLVTNFLIGKDMPVRGIAHPLSGVPNRLRKEFFEAIGQENKKKVFEAIDYFMDNK